MATQATGSANPMQLLQMTEGLVLHQSLHVAAKLGVADLLKDGKRSAAEMARDLKVNEDAFYRVLRYLAGRGVFVEGPEGEFANTALSQFMRSDVPGSMRPMLIFRGTHYFFDSFTEFLYSVETGKPGREKLLGGNGFEYLAQNPEEARIFDDAMTAGSAVAAPAIASGYDFGQWGSVMDVGGGNGILLAAILRQYPQLRGTLADREHVLERAKQRGFLGGDSATRATFTPCDFFQGISPGSRAYVMKNVIHDWDDEASIEILRNTRKAVPADGALLLVELTVGETNQASFGKSVDMIMLAVTGGKERTVQEYASLLGAGGFRLNKTFPVSDTLMVIEALPG